MRSIGHFPNYKWRYNLTRDFFSLLSCEYFLVSDSLKLLRVSKFLHNCWAIKWISAYHLVISAFGLHLIISSPFSRLARSLRPSAAGGPAWLAALWVSVGASLLPWSCLVSWRTGIDWHRGLCFLLTVISG